MKAGSSLMEGWMADEESKAEKALAYRDAVIAEQNATAIRLKGRFDQLRHAEAAERVMGRLTAQLGASGARLDVGAPMSLLVEQAGELELDNMLIGHAAEVQALGLEDQARMLRYSGKMARRRGKNIKRASILGAVGISAQGYGKGKELFGKP